MINKYFFLNLKSGLSGEGMTKIDNLNRGYSTIFSYLDECVKKGKICRNEGIKIKMELSKVYQKSYASIFIEDRAERIFNQFGKQLERTVKNLR